MYIINNALKNLFRNMGRNILLSVIILVIVATTVVTLSISRTAEEIIDDYYQRFGSRVIIAPDMEAVMAEMQRALTQREVQDSPQPIPMPNPQMTPQQSLAFANSRYIMEYALTARHGADNPDLVAVDAEAGMGALMTMENSEADGADVDMDDIVIPHFRIMGNAWDDFELGRRTLMEGDMPKGYGEALISSEVAKLNGLSVGDEITLNSNLMSEGRVRKIIRSLVITGIYLDMTENQMFMPTSFMNRRNEVLTDLDTVISHMGTDDFGIQIEATYYLHDPSYLEAFEAEIRAGGLDDMLLVSTDEAGYNAIVAPILGLRRVATTFLWIVLVLGGVVLTVLSSIAIRERKYEIGVLRAMGLKKHKVAFGLWAEMLAITTACLVVGLALGSLAAQPVSDVLLAAQLVGEAEETGTASQGFNISSIGGSGGRLFGGEESPAPLNNMDVSLRLGTVLQIIGISLLLTSFAAFISILRITKYEPMKILMERD